ncbi:hypothetical protein SPRG_00358 [Saprolegnia parasitica CBS 223.65]|uniref:Uncharacterized protein n=1 Tax=Saprolegnia parasitica (strain CBS 223.65) TaxID=695850 RepID=A0A067DA37_SAPPC|nr:hypothetical protein SPRG_00358 [Saprolegnia parasitica CBS 223.65]KDO35511.1 hypothetical protein SPRG_00358 [Saprolegnia parasitica CBS 223.65]|eukprot:XP_012193847.1 hypothetical protein SPRG_00358 [Saprolegnia parasitica CBS 223.65]
MQVLPSLPQGGPQEARSRRLLQRDQPFDRPLPPLPKERDFVVPSDFRAQEEAYQEKLAAQTDELAFLKKYVERILNQLRRVLVKHNELEQLQQLCDPIALQADDDGSAPLPSPPWFTSKEYMSPLFAAYESRIKELEATVDKHKRDLDAFVGHADALARENERLQHELSVTMDKLVLQSDVPASMRSGVDFFTDQRKPDMSVNDTLADLNERIELLMSENSLLVEQASLQETELDEFRRDVAERDAQLLTMSQNFNQATLAVQELRDTNDHMKHDKQRAEAQVQQFAATIAQLEAQKESILAHVQSHKDAVAKYELQVQEYEHRLAQIKAANEQKQNVVTKRYQGVCDRLRELTSALDGKDKQLEQLQELFNATSHELDMVKSDCEGMLKVMQSMEKQLGEYASREDAVTELERASQERAQAAILERDQAKAKETQCRREIARLTEQKRVAASEYLKLQDESVEKLRRKLENELAYRSDELKHAQTTIVTLKMQLENAMRLHVDAERSLRDLTTQSEARVAAFQDKFEHMVARVASSELARDEALAKENQSAASLVAKELQFERVLAEVQEKWQMERDQKGGLERELEVRRAEVREANEALAAKERHVVSMTKELHDVRSEVSAKQKYQIDMYVQQIRELKARLDQVETELVRAKNENTKMEHMLRMDHQRMEGRFKSEMDVSASRLSRLKDEKARVESQLQEVQARHASYGSKIIALEQELAEAHHQCSQMHMHVEEAERKASDVGAQLAMLLATQHQHVRHDVELKSALDRTRLEKARLERELSVLRKTPMSSESSSMQKALLIESRGS